MDPRGPQRGRLLEALALFGAVFLAPGWEEELRGPVGDAPFEVKGDPSVPSAARWLGLPKILDPAFEKWRNLLIEAQSHRDQWASRPVVHRRFLRLSFREDLRRTLEGQDKGHEPDERMTFGLSDSSAKSRFIDWGDLRWVIDGYQVLKGAVAGLLERELAPLCQQETGPRESLGVKVRRGRESWGQSALRHCVYPSGGTCSCHTDYGLVSLQLSNSPGLEALIDGSWHLCEPPQGFSLLFAGDMLERLSNGRIKALVHRVRVEPSSPVSPSSPSLGAQGTPGGRKPVVRQSHILFLQPDADSIVAPLVPYQTDGGPCLEPVRYGDWHNTKVELAFDRPMKSASTRRW
ncbi:unnamed protein product [Polarella glacialis]|nr:unnamed protein product [Polarella glacialis]